MSGKKKSEMLVFNEHTFDIIKEATFKQLPNTKIAELLGISETTYRYHLTQNTANLRERVRAYEIDFMLSEAERVSREILSIDASNGGKRIDAKVLEVKQKEAAFLREKLVKAREVYDSKNNNLNIVVAPVPILGGLLDERKEVKADVV